MAEPRARRAARPREEVFAAARTAIAEHGLAKLTMAGLGKQLQMSAGHLLYYFGSKDQLLLETLHWSEEQLGERRRAALARPGATGRERLAAYAGLYLPEGPGDPRWILWVEVWGRSPASAEIRQGQQAIEVPWHADLVGVIEDGVATGEFALAGARPGPAPESAPTGPDASSTGPESAPAGRGSVQDVATQIRALLDGFAVPIAIGLPGARREDALAQVAAVTTALLGPR
ncbi:TetR family transcriptional regulator C-terminal domain-containing protein [Kitasatospora sp. NPDC048540]|uniref:TetR family transcriptional regulator C-terminal domain-containing protein n=1 Tax=unclassified Kitasatospora TaxID=2633591 RepID=UPI00053B6499|nr:TetR family transcriptional regulator C-terminal domain-containing protein [Kitasatospora sp. MBT63]